MALGKQFLYQVRTDESAGTSYEDGLIVGCQHWPLRGDRNAYVLESKEGDERDKPLLWSGP